MIRVVIAAGVLLVLASCATTPEAARDDQGDVVATAALSTLEAVRRSPVQRFVKEAPSVVRKGIAHLVTLVPLDEARSARLAPAVGASFIADRLEVETAARLERALGTEELAAFAQALETPRVAAVVSAAVAQEPDPAALERFMADRKALPEARRARVKALVDASWSPSVLDRLSRAPVAVAGRVVAAALKDDDDQRRTELLRIAEAGRPSDPRALVVAFAFLWRELDDAVLDEATAYFTSAPGQRATAALLEAATSSLAQLAADVEKRVR